VDSNSSISGAFTIRQETFLLTITHTVDPKILTFAPESPCAYICIYVCIYIYYIYYIYTHTHTHMHIHTHLTCLNWICYWFILRPSIISSDSLFPIQCILAVSLLWFVTHKAGRDKYRCFLSNMLFRNLLLANSIRLQMMRPLMNNRIYKKWPWPIPDTIPELAFRYCRRLPAA